MTRYDAERLHLLITRHARFTGSRRAARDPRRTGTTICPKFRKVMPVEYRRALAEMAKEKAAHACRRRSKRMGKITGFLEFERNDRDYEPVEERIKHWHEFVLPLPEEETPQAGRALHGLRHSVLPRH